MGKKAEPLPGVLFPKKLKTVFLPTRQNKGKNFGYFASFFAPDLGNMGQLLVGISKPFSGRSFLWKRGGPPNPTICPHPQSQK